MNITTGSNQVFSDLVSLATIFGLFNWISIMVTYLSFRRGMEAQNITRASLPYTESWMKLRVSGSLFITCLVVVFNGMLTFCAVSSAVSIIECMLIYVHYLGVNSFIPSFQAKPFVFAYVGIPIHIVLILAPKLLFQYSRVQPGSMDLSTGRITAEEKQASEGEEKREISRSDWHIIALFRRRSSE
jgi:amino acid transporter